jgi:hypothetical protein
MYFINTKSQNNVKIQDKEKEHFCEESDSAWYFLFVLLFYLEHGGNICL